VTCEIVNGWIMEVLKEIHNRKQIITVTHYLLTNEHTLGNLLKVYSFVKHCYDTSSLRKYDNW
jgi:hypothetical protein